MNIVAIHPVLYFIDFLNKKSLYAMRTDSFQKIRIYMLPWQITFSE